MNIWCHWMFFIANSDKTTIMTTVERFLENDWRNTIWYQKVFLKLICKEDGKLHDFNTTNVTFQMLLQHPEIQKQSCKLYLQNVPIDYILQNIALYNNISSICEHPELRIEHILAHPLLCWNWNDLSYNMNISFADIANNKHLHWDWRAISGRLDLQIDFVVENSCLYWNWNEISKHPNLTITHVKTHQKLFIKDGSLRPEWNWFEVCANRHIPITDILANYGVSGCIPYNPYIDDDLANRHDVTFEIITSNPYIIWNWNAVGRNKNITMKHISNNLQAGREYMYFIPAFVKQPLGIPCIVWDWSAISNNPNLTIDFVLKNRYEKWNWEAVTENKNIKLADIIKFKDVLPLCKHAIAYREKTDYIIANLNNKDKMTKHYSCWCRCETYHRPKLAVKCIFQEIKMNRDWEWSFRCPNMRIDDVLLLLDNYPYDMLQSFSRSLCHVRQHTFKMDMLDYVEQKTKWLLVVSMYEDLQQYAKTDGNQFMKMEHILFNPIIAKLIAMQ